MNLTDHNLLDALRLLTPAERAAVEGVLKDEEWQPQHEALRALRSETLRRLRRLGGLN
jgi:hypothetical protein